MRNCIKCSSLIKCKLPPKKGVRLEENTLIQINRLSVRFGDSTVLKELSLVIGKAQTLSIVGESGSGKSLTALSILRLLPAGAQLSGEILLQAKTKGTNEAAASKAAPIHLNALDMAALQSIRGAGIAMIFQEPMSSLNPVISCGDQVVEAIRSHQELPYKAAKQRVIQLFKEVQLPEPAKTFDKYPHQISGGQKQRVMIAMAMSCSPRLLICDEPTTALDVLVQKEILQLIRDLQKRSSMSVLFISHDIQLVSEISDQIAVLYKGDLVEIGPAQQLLKAPKHPYTKALLSCRPSLYDKGQRLPVVADFLANSASPQPAAALLNQQPASSAITQPTTSLNPILEIKDLNIWYPNKRDFWGRPTGYFKAIQDLNLTVYKGETLGLVGGSGCGKTTLGRSLMGLTPIHSGSIWLDGQPHPAPGVTKAQAATTLQMIFQDPYSALNPRITVGQQIAEALQVHGLCSAKQAKVKVTNWLDKVGLPSNCYDRYPHQFSGGQRQRLVIARALILAPKIVICDESVSALDVSVQAQILNLFNDLKKELGFTSIFISHDLSVVRYISDRIAVMNGGLIEELGPAEKVYHHPQSAYTQSLLAATQVPQTHLLFNQ